MSDQPTEYLQRLYPACTEHKYLEKSAFQKQHLGVPPASQIYHPGYAYAIAELKQQGNKGLGHTELRAKGTPRTRTQERDLHLNFTAAIQHRLTCPSLHHQNATEEDKQWQH